MKTVKFKTNINCDSCIKTVSPILNDLDNIDLWKVDTENPDKILTIKIDDEDTNSIISGIKKAGFEIEEIK